MNIVDVNDNSLYFIFSNIIYIFEYVIIGDIVIIVMVVDLDVGSNSNISFSLVKIDVLVLFSLGAINGIFRVLGSLDREVRDRYVVKVIVVD